MDRINNEKQFHNKTFTENTRNKTSKFYSITQCSRNYYLNFLKNNCTGKKALEYGCGPGSSAIFLKKNGATVTGIDISEDAINLAAEAAKKEGSSDINFLVMNAEKLTLGKNSFQLICGSGIIHHLDTKEAFSELARVLTPDGCAIFLEPLGHNPLINWYRNLTPKLRTPDEHPLMLSDLWLAKSFFKEVDLQYFHLCSLMTVPFRKLSFFKQILNWSDKIDETIFKIFPFIQRFAWTVAITLRKPYK